MSSLSHNTVKHIIFDLDGTLIDSAPSILASMQVAFTQAGIEPARPFTYDLIGPPLAVAMASMLTNDTLGELSVLMESYKRHYDELGYRETAFYIGVPDMLRELRQMGLRLYIATNKRILPTRKIIEYFGWTALFDGLYSLDQFTPTLQNKEAMLQRLGQELPGMLEGAIYVGDRAEDADAAMANNLRFIWASWGYSPSDLEVEGYVRAEVSAHLTNIIKGKIYSGE